MSHFEAKMHQIRFRLGFCPDPVGGAYSAPPDPLTGFNGSYFKGKGGEEKERDVGRGKEGKRRGEKGRGGRKRRVNGPPTQIL